MAFKALECETKCETTSCEIPTPTFCWKIIQSCYTSAVGGSWLWQMCNVERRGGESSLCTTPPLSPSFPPLQPPTSPLPVRSLLDLMHAGLLLVLLCVFHLAVHLLFPTSSSSARDHLILYILTISQQPRPTHSQRPPIKLAQGSTLLFGSFPSSPWASCPSQSMGGGQATLLAFQEKSTSDFNDVGTVLLLAMFYVSKIDAWHVK